ncbi:MAG: YdeI/OmpD-associated family protein [Anaerolineales bacterium]
MSKKYTFNATIIGTGGRGAYVQIPFDVEQAFGKKRVPVQAEINGELYRGTLVRMGDPYHILIVLKGIRQKIGKEIGDEVEVVLEEDTQPRVVDVPDDFIEALGKSPVAKTVFEKMSYTHQKEYVNAILDAKHESTRRDRIRKTIEMLKQVKRGK